MKAPTLKTETIVKHYWACAVPHHRHQTKEVAQQCLAARPEHNPKQRRWPAPALEALLCEYEAGNTLKVLGDRHGISKGRCGQLLQRARRLRERRDEPPRLFDDLPASIRGALIELGYETAEQVAEGWITNWRKPPRWSGMAVYGRLHGVGRKGMQVLQDWLLDRGLIAPDARST